MRSRILPVSLEKSTSIQAGEPLTEIAADSMSYLLMMLMYRSQKNIIFRHPTISETAEKINIDSTMEDLDLSSPKKVNIQSSEKFCSKLCIFLLKHWQGHARCMESGQKLCQTGGEGDQMWGFIEFVPLLKIVKSKAGAFTCLADDDDATASICAWYRVYLNPIWV